MLVWIRFDLFLYVFYLLGWFVFVVYRREARAENKYNARKYGHLSKALEIAQHSTASMAKFDNLSKNEPKPRLKKNNIKNARKKQASNLNSNKMEETAKQKEILFNIFGKQSNDAFNVKKASKSAKIEMEIKRSRKKKRR